MAGCDGCTACCKVMHVRELDKPGDTWCPHCTIGTGCGIYETRPASCRTFECVWLKTQQSTNPLPLELRPNTSGVVIGTTNAGEDIVLYVNPDRPEAWKRGGIGRLVAAMRSDGIKVLVKTGARIEQLP